MLNKIKEKYHDFLSSDANNPNKRFKNKNLLYAAGLGVLVLVALIAIKLVVLHKNKAVLPIQKDKTNWVKVHSSNFTVADNKSALDNQQHTIDKLTRLLKEQNNHISSLENNLDSFKSESQKDKSKIVDLINDSKGDDTDKSTSNKSNDSLPAPTTTQPHGQQISGNVTGNTQAFGLPQGQGQGMGYQSPTIQTFTINYNIGTKSKAHLKTAKNYVPTGTFCRARLLGGAEAQAGVDAQGDTSPILFKLLNNCYLPNGQHSMLKGSLVTAAVYGKLASERGIVRLDRLSYIRKDNSILDIPVQGTAFDIGGKNGIHGIPILKNGKIIQMAGLSGILGGLGESAKQFASTQSVSPLGTTTSIDSSKIMPYALGSGTSSAMSKISDLYIKLAEQEQPVIELNAGAIVDLVFLKGFPITDEDKIQQYQSSVDDKRSKGSLSQQMLNVASNSSLGAIPQSMNNITSNFQTNKRG